jgi:hypothetical protein
LVVALSGKRIFLMRSMMTERSLADAWTYMPFELSLNAVPSAAESCSRVSLNLSDPTIRLLEVSGGVVRSGGGRRLIAARTVSLLSPVSTVQGDEPRTGDAMRARAAAELTGSGIEEA